MELKIKFFHKYSLSYEQFYNNALRLIITLSV